MKQMSLDTLRLRFPEELEQAFREDHFVKSLNQLRFGIILGTALYAVFGILDALIFPETKIQSWFIRYGIVAPVCLLTLLFTFSRHFKKFMQPAIMTAVIVSGAGIVAMMILVRSPQNYFHFAGLLIVFTYTYTFSKLRFIYTTLASWIIVVLYEITALTIMDFPMPVIVNDNFFYISVNLIGMFSCHHRELYFRKDFLQSMMIKDLEEAKRLKEKEKIFRDLHDGIGGITTNISLLAQIGQKAKSDADIKKTLDTISRLSQEGLREIRDIMHSFDAAPKTWQAMAAELRRQGSTMIEPHGISFNIQTFIDTAPQQPDSFLWLNLFRIYKEALTNVMKHAAAKSVKVSLDVNQEGLFLSIADDGIGLRREKKAGRGIANMKARAQEIGAILKLGSDNGTIIRLELPSTAQESA